MSTKRIRGWDEFAKESQENYDKFKVKEVEIPVDENESYRIPFPRKKQIKALNAALMVQDWDAATVALLGEDAGNRFVELSDGEHGNILIPLCMEVLKAFALNVQGLEGKAESDGLEPNWPDESTSSTDSENTSSTTSSSEESNSTTISGELDLGDS